MIKSVCLMLLMTKSNVTFANEVQGFNFFNSELLHYLLFDLVFITSIWLLFYVCKIALTSSKQKTKKHYSIYSLYHSEPESISGKTPVV